MGLKFAAHHHLISVLVKVLSCGSTVGSCLIFLYYLWEGKISKGAINYRDVMHAFKLYSTFARAGHSLDAINE